MEVASPLLDCYLYFCACLTCYITLNKNDVEFRCELPLSKMHLITYYLVISCINKMDHSHFPITSSAPPNPHTRCDLPMLSSFLPLIRLPEQTFWISRSGFSWWEIICSCCSILPPRWELLHMEWLGGTGKRNPVFWWEPSDFMCFPSLNSLWSAQVLGV